MNDADITKLAAKLTKSLATQDNIREIKDELKKLATKVELKILEKKIDRLEDKTSVILEFAENVNEDHEKRLKKIEAIPIIAHQLKK